MATTEFKVGTQPKKALITGITGFVGPHLARHLLEEGLEVFGIARWRSNTNRLEGLNIKLENGDVRDGVSLQKVISEIRPDYIFHLAAQSFVRESWNAPLETVGTNVLGCINILEAVRQSNPECIVHIAGSSEEYGRIETKNLPVTESCLLQPLSPYGVSKVAQDLLGQQYWHSYGIKTVITRAFNHEGPGRGEVFATSTFAKQIAEIEKGKKPTIYVGNLEAVRDYTDVRDTVRAYLLATRLCNFGEPYNICSGVGWSMEKMLRTLLELSTFQSSICIEEDPSRLRPSDVPILLGDCSKFKERTSWKPQIPFTQTLEDLLNYWRQRT